MLPAYGAVIGYLAGGIGSFYGSLKVTGFVNKHRSYSLNDIVAFPKEDLVLFTAMACITYPLTTRLGIWLGKYMGDKLAVASKPAVEAGKNLIDIVIDTVRAIPLHRERYWKELGDKLSQK